MNLVSKCNHGRRQAFTLVELLVVTAIMLVLMVLAAAIVPGMRQDMRVTDGASQVQGLLAMTRQWALRDGRQAGVQINTASSNGTYTTSITFMEQPPDYTVAGATVTVAGGTATFSSGNPPLSPASNFLVLGLNSSTPMPYTLSVSGNPATYSTSAPATAMPAPTDWRIIRGPLPRVGEQPVMLASGVVVNTSVNGTCDSTTQTFPGTIMFSPSGEVIAPGYTGRFIYLWVMDTNITGGLTPSGNGFAGTLQLICINTETGKISASQVNTAFASGHYTSPYSFAIQGTGSGL